MRGRRTGEHEHERLRDDACLCNDAGAFGMLDNYAAGCECRNFDAEQSVEDSDEHAVEHADEHSDENSDEHSDENSDGHSVELSVEQSLKGGQ